MIKAYDRTNKYSNFWALSDGVIFQCGYETVGMIMQIASPDSSGIQQSNSRGLGKSV